MRGPMLVDVLGLEGAKAGRRPTDEEHARLAKMLHESMDAGGCGWSAQRLPPTGPAAVQRDWDGTPMPTDVMHDETCNVLARVLGDRNQGIQQVTLTTATSATTWPTSRSSPHVASVSHTCCMHSRAAARPPPCDRWWSVAGTAYDLGSASPRRGFTFPSRTGPVRHSTRGWSDYRTVESVSKSCLSARPRPQGQPPYVATPDRDGPPVRRRSRLAGSVPEDFGRSVAEARYAPVDALLDPPRRLVRTCVLVAPRRAVRPLRNVSTPHVWVADGVRTRSSDGRSVSDRACAQQSATTVDHLREPIALPGGAQLPFPPRGLIRLDGPADVVVYTLRISRSAERGRRGLARRRVADPEGIGYHAVLFNGLRTIADAQTEGPPSAACHGRG